jgi:GDPmannose 4,6-dehydratase
MSRRALISGVSGQDGAYLARYLLGRGYTVCGTSRAAQLASFTGLELLGIKSQIQLETMVPTDFRSVLQTLSRFEPDEVYGLAGQSSVGLSFHQPVETLESIALGTLNLLEAVRYIGKPIRLYNAASSECFGDTGSTPAVERTPFRPRSPYAVAKATAFWEVVNYREAYGLFACSGITFNHDSPLRPMHFVTRKVVAAAVHIAAGSRDKLYLGNLAVQRDWGWAPEYVEAMWKILQHESAQDFVIATGDTRSLESFVAAAFAEVKLDWHEHVRFDPALERPSDLGTSMGDPSRIDEKLGWRAKSRMRDVVRRMVEVEKLRLHGNLTADVLC